MKKAILLVASAFALLASVATAEDGFVPIFNGKDLTGWKSNEEKPGCFTVEDGALKVSGGRAHLFYMGPDGKAAFSDFELKLKVKTLPNANGGVYFHTEYEDSGWPSKGYECQVNASHKDPKKTGSLYGVVNVLVLAPGQKTPPGSLEDIVVEEAPNADGEWFDYHISVKGKTITLKVNGKTTVEWTEPEDFDPAKALQNMPGRKLGRGTFAIQGHDPDSTAYYKDIQLKVLD
ncbi:3-keto-disaccharide hydrolase [Haloferula sp.]|uniref:3-keto-disaccharide hydrolase n=1 Tax=Haloferula sp. TaxID=2497595 RepID=UPI003C78D81D